MHRLIKRSEDSFDPQEFPQDIHISKVLRPKQIITRHDIVRVK